MQDMDSPPEEVAASAKAPATPQPAPASPPPAPDNLNAASGAMRTMSPYVSGLKTLRTIAGQSNIPALATGAGRGVMQGAGGALGALSMVDGELQLANGVRRGNAS